MNSKRQIGRARVSRPPNNWEWFSSCLKWHFDTDWVKFEKRWGDVFQIYSNAIHFNPLQCFSDPAMSPRRCKMSMKISIDILLLSVIPIRSCKVFGQISRVINLKKRNSFHSNALLLVKVWSFGDLLRIPWSKMSKFGLS